MGRLPLASKWLNYLRDNEEMLEDFLAWLDGRIAQAQAEQDKATTWETAKEALGSKKSLDGIKTYVKVNIQEDKTYAAHVKSTRVRSA
jgi:hypothetical protein